MFVNRLIDWVSEWLIEWVSDWLIDWSIDWLTSIRCKFWKNGVVGFFTNILWIFVCRLVTKMVVDLILWKKHWIGADVIIFRLAPNVSPDQLFNVAAFDTSLSCMIMCRIAGSNFHGWNLNMPNGARMNAAKPTDKRQSDLPLEFSVDRNVGQEITAAPTDPRTHPVGIASVFTERQPFWTSSDSSVSLDAFPPFLSIYSHPHSFFYFEKLFFLFFFLLFSFFFLVWFLCFFYSEKNVLFFFFLQGFFFFFYLF